MIVFWLVWGLAGLLVLAYGAVILIGAPYLPTKKAQITDALDLLDLQPGQVVVDLGCGDGSFLKAAAERGLRAVGYEVNPFLAAIAWGRTRRYGRLVKIKLGNFWRADLKTADGMFVFLIGHHMRRLDKMIQKRGGARPLKLVSHAFKIPGKKAECQKGPLFLYRYR